MLIIRWFRRTARGLAQNVDRRAWAGLLVVAVIVGIIIAIPVENEPVDLNVLRVTLDAASTRANIGVATISAGLTLTPAEAVLTNAAPTVSMSGLLEVREFAASAQADSQTDTLEGGAVQAAGPPNIEACGDSAMAWAPAAGQTTGQLTLLYAELVRPTAILIHQSYNPGFVTNVTLTDLYGEDHVVYEGQPAPGFQCPFVMVVLIDNVTYAANIVHISVDYTTSAGGPIQIDAVELVGIRYN